MPKLDLSCFEDFPILKTERLTLRQIGLQDIKEIFEMRSNSRVSTYIYRPLMENLEDAKDILGKVRDQYKTKQAIGWAAVLRDKPEIVGTCGLVRFNHDNFRAEIGGEMLPKYWGKGIAQEAVTEIIRYGMEVINLHAIEAWIAPGNRGADRILKDSGFEQEAHFKKIAYHEGFHDMAVYTLLNKHFKED
jgi:ribosomal-protein-alanine N-acetyltransferase